jgi:hypothetical protein
VRSRRPRRPDAEALAAALAESETDYAVTESLRDMAIAREMEEMQIYMATLLSEKQNKP